MRLHLKTPNNADHLNSRRKNGLSLKFHQAIKLNNKLRITPVVVICFVKHYI